MTSENAIRFDQIKCLKIARNVFSVFPQIYVKLHLVIKYYTIKSGKKIVSKKQPEWQKSINFKWAVYWTEPFKFITIYSLQIMHSTVGVPLSLCFHYTRVNKLGHTVKKDGGPVLPLFWCNFTAFYVEHVKLHVNICNFTFSFSDTRSFCNDYFLLYPTAEEYD